MTVRPFGRAGAAVLSIGLLLAGPLAGCSSDASSDGSPQPSTQAAAVQTPAPPIAAGDAPLRVELIRRAVAAVEVALGAPQQFFEVNATPTIVNLFVAADDATQAISYVYAAGVLGEPAAPQPASGPTFAATDIDFDETLVLAQVRSQLVTSEFRLFSLTGLDAGGVQYRAVIDSSRNAEFVVFLSGDGSILGTDQNLGIGDS